MLRETGKAESDRLFAAAKSAYLRKQELSEKAKKNSDDENRLVNDLYDNMALTEKLSV